jgi:glutaconate CoA-transferase, subunit B
VVTDLAVFDFDEDTRRMRAIALNPGVSCEQVQANTGFPLAFAQDLQETEAPSAEELAMLRYLDPDRRYTA